ncbi:MAG: undecaprenyl-diphosphate phosphatase [Bdellovibrionota bacterium]
MSDVLLAALLGVVEGITEFLPISSTAHLRIAQHLLGISLENEFWKLFAIFIQLGAILSVVVIYREKLLGYAKKPFQHSVYLFAVAFVCTAGPAFLLKKVIGQNLESIFVMMASLAIGGVIMIVVDKIFVGGRTKAISEMGYGQAIFIGLCQILSAVFPGTSRSMSTIASGQMVSLTRATAIEFSFLLSIPIMVVATLYDLLKYVKSTPVGLSSHEIVLLAIGFIVSFLVGYIVVIWFLGYVRKHGFLAFGIYRILLAAALFFL